VDYQARRSSIVSQIEARGATSLICTSPSEIRYLTGFSGTTAVLLVSPEGELFVDFRYREQASQQVDAVDVRADSQPATLWSDFLKELEGRSAHLAIDPQRATAAQYLDLAGAGVPPILVAGIVDQARAIKDEMEIDLLRIAQGFADAVMQDVWAQISPGISADRGGDGRVDGAAVGC
jgi:Xaa-Pro aminopeptidase